MGQAGSKPPIRTVIPYDENAVTDLVNDTGEETEAATDTLGIIAEESDYPEPEPHVRKSKHGVKEVKDVNDVLKDTTDDDDDKEQKQHTKLEDFAQVELVPVGASFKNYSKKKKKEISFEDDNISIIQNELTKVMMSSGSRTLLTARSTPKEYTKTMSTKSTSKTIETDLGSDISKTTQRELMLTEREKFEFRRFQAPSTDRAPTRGQVRRWTFDMPQPRSAAGLVDNYRSVEDRIAEELAEKHREHRAESYSELVKDLNMHLKSDRLKVKVILAWINKQNIGRLSFGPKLPAPDTPNGYMMLIQENQGTYPVFFALLCRAANLKCVIISGISKGSKYEVGSKDTEGLANTWNAVYVDGSWQLVHPLWTCKGIANRQPGGWMKIEQEGKARRSLSIATSGQDVHSFNPYFIFTKPDEFIVRNFPDEQKWQLLPNPLTIDEFMEQMYIRPIFFLNKFKLLSENKCKLVSENGEPSEIKISFPKSKLHDVVFGYEFSIKIENNNNNDDTKIIENNETGDEKDEESLVIENVDENEDTSKAVLEETERYVMVKKSETEVTFEVRFSKIGLYKLRLFGGYYSEFGSKPPWILDVLLECKNMIPKPQPLPFEPGIVGWGPGPISESLGLFVPSLTESSLNIAEFEEALLYFVVQEKMFVQSELHHCKIGKDKLKPFVETHIIEKEKILTLQIIVRCPGGAPTDFGLKILVQKHGELINACNYMVQTRKQRIMESYHIRRAKQHVFEGVEKLDIDLLTTALEECIKHEVPMSDPEVVGGKNTLEFLECKRELYVALLVNRIDVAEHALYRTRTSNLDVLLGKECTKVEEHLEHMLKLDAEGWTCEIPEIDRLSLVELSHFRKPKVEIRLVVVAMYMLLGVEEDLLKDWNKVRRYLRDQQTTLVEIARLEKYISLETTNKVFVEKYVIERVEEILMNYTEEDIRRVDNTAAAYYKWVVGVTRKLKQKIEEEEEESRLHMLQELEMSTPKSRSAQVNGSAIHSKSGFKAPLGPLKQASIANPSMNGYKTGMTDTVRSNRTPFTADQLSVTSRKPAKGASAFSRVPATPSEARLPNIDEIASNRINDTPVSLDINGVGIRPSKKESRLSNRPGYTSRNAPSRLSAKSGETSVSAPSRNDPSPSLHAPPQVATKPGGTSEHAPNKSPSKLAPTKTNKNAISGNTFFSDRGSIPASANKTRPPK
ncbi:hypothetical protein ACF0H5_013155 [Mactra antiquata]